MTKTSKDLNSSAGLDLPGDDTTIVAKAASNSWGWLPALSVTSAVGVFLEALAAEEGRLAAPWSESLFWCGLLALFLPVTVRMISPQPARRERIALLVMLGSAFYFLRDLDYPLSFAYNDEFIHWRGAYDLATNAHLFYPNPLLPVGPFYPGLEIATNALSSLTGLSIFASALVLLGIAGLVLVLSLYLFFEHLSNSAQVAGIATLLYMTVPGFFDETQFAYESLALPLAVFVVFLVARRNSLPAGHRKGITLAIWLGLAAVVITHHVTSYALVAFLLLWTAAFLLPRVLPSFWKSHGQKVQAGPGGAALVGLVLAVVWVIFTEERVLGYLSPTLETSVRLFTQVLAGEGPPHQLFRDGSGFVEPLWQRMTAFASVALILVGLPFGLFQIWRHHRSNAAILALAVGVFLYPATQVAHLAPIGDTTSRIPVFLFPAIAFVLAIGITQFWLSRIPSWKLFVAVISAIAIIFTGGWVTGTAPSWYRLPGPYLVAADHRSVGLEGVAAAEWMRSSLGPGHRTASDLSDTFLMGTYGYQWVITLSGDKIQVAPVFTSLQLGPKEKGILRGAAVQYLVVDRRLSIGLPHTGAYFNGGEPNEGHYTRPIDAAALAKFDDVENVSRIFDSGDTIIYDVEAISNGQSATSTSQPSCTPTPSATGLPSHPNVARFYTGTIYDIPTGITTNISLTGIQQQQGRICGYFGDLPANAPINGSLANASFKGTITATKQIQFVVTSDIGQVTFSFDGAIQPDGIMAGTFCSPVSSAGKCSDYGLWSVSPARSG